MAAETVSACHLGDRTQLSAGCHLGLSILLVQLANRALLSVPAAMLK